MKRAIIFLTMCFVCILVVSAQTQPGTIQELTGTVELMPAGSSAWEPAQRGQSLNSDTVISTGFRSTAVVQAGSAVITVRPLTRLSLTELVTAEGSETLNVDLQTGRVRVEVKPPAGTRSYTTIQSGSATASVRGTVFDFDTINLTVREGTVEFAGANGASVLIDAGGFSYIDDRANRAASAEDTINFELKPDLPVTTGLVDSFDSDITRSTTPSAESLVEVITTIGF